MKRFYKLCKKKNYYFVYMKKTTNISPDKSRSIRQLKNIKFDLNPLNYKCFISHTQKILNRSDGASPTHLCDNDLSQEITKSSNTRLSQLRIPYIRRNIKQNISSYYPQFNTQVLLMQYEKDQVYTDSIKNGSQKQADLDSKSVNSQISEQNQIVKSCLKMLSDETDTQASSPPRYASTAQNQYFTNVSNYYSGYRSQNPELNSFAIDLTKVQFDGRTTIMIRNIPNKYSESLLLDLFNKNHKKKIDFFYLPIDYKNNCNVGYAFMNFVNPKYVEDFYNEFHNKKWKFFNSEKICHICYARIQGAFQLSNHFEASKKLREAEK